MYKVLVFMLGIMIRYVGTRSLRGCYYPLQKTTSKRVYMYSSENLNYMRRQDDKRAISLIYFVPIKVFIEVTIASDLYRDVST